MQSLLLAQIGVDDNISEAELIFEQEERDSLRGGRTLPTNHQARHEYLAPIKQASQVTQRRHAVRQPITRQPKQMVQHRQPLVCWAKDTILMIQEEGAINDNATHT